MKKWVSSCAFNIFQHLSTHSINYFLGSSFHADKTASLQFLEGVFGDSKPMRLMIFMTCIGKSTDCNAIPSHTQYGYCIYHRFILCIYIYIYSFIDLSKHILHIYIYTFIDACTYENMYICIYIYIYLYMYTSVPYTSQ